MSPIRNTKLAILTSNHTCRRDLQLKNVAHYAVTVGGKKQNESATVTKPNTGPQ